MDTTPPKLTGIQRIRSLSDPIKRIPTIIITAPLSSNKAKKYPLVPKFIESVTRYNFKSMPKNPTPPGAPKKPIKRANACGPDELIKQFRSSKAPKKRIKVKKPKQKHVEIRERNLLNQNKYLSRVIPPFPTIQEGLDFPQMEIDEDFTLKSARILARKDGLCMIYYNNVPIDIDRVKELMDRSSALAQANLKKLAEADAIIGLKNLKSL